MKPEQIVGILLDAEEEPFDPRDYFMQSTLSTVTQRLGLEWLNWGVWYKEYGPFRLYVDPWEKQPWMEIEVGMDVGHDQIKLVNEHVSQQDADTLLPAVVDVLTKHAGFNARMGAYDDGVSSELMALLKPHIVYESDDFNAREFFQQTELPARAAASELGFEDRASEGGRRWQAKVIGQFEVIVHAGEKGVDVTHNEAVIHVYRDFGWQKEMLSLMYVGDAKVRQCLEQIVSVLQEHTTEDGWATGNEHEVRIKLERIKHDAERA